MSRTYRHANKNAFRAKYVEGRDGSVHEICTAARDGKLNAYATWWAAGRTKARLKKTATREVRRHENRELAMLLATEL